MKPKAKAPTSIYCSLTLAFDPMRCQHIDKLILYFKKLDSISPFAAPNVDLTPKLISLVFIDISMHESSSRALY